MLRYNLEIIFSDNFFFKLKLVVHDIHKQISKLHQKCYRNFVSIKITKNFIQTSKIIIFTLWWKIIHNVNTLNWDIQLIIYEFLQNILSASPIKSYLLSFLFPKILKITNDNVSYYVNSKIICNVLNHLHSKDCWHTNWSLSLHIE